jgi:hypothetical protein
MRIGRKTDLLSPEERAIVDRLERGEIDATEAGRLLIESVQRIGDVVVSREPDPGDDSAVDPNETPEQAAARELVERIAREVDQELGR